MATSAEKLRKPVVEFDVETHTYYADGVELPGVTTVLKRAGMVDDTWYTDYGRWRGSAVHKACALHLTRSLDQKSLDPAIRARFGRFLEFMKQSTFVPLHVEESGCDTVYGYAGTFDAAGFFVEEHKTDQEARPTTVIEIKNFSDGSIPAWVRLQLAAYGRLLDPVKIWRRIVVNLTDEKFTVHEFPVETYLDDINDFLAAVRVARWHERNG